MAINVRKNPVCLSLGVLACNEKDSIRRTLESLFRQNVFEKLWHRHEQCEVVVVANGCADQTAAIAQDTLDHIVRTHEWAEAISVRVVEIPEAGKCNAWNRFVHEFSSLEARYLGVMGARITFPHRNTLFALIAALDRRAYANLVSGQRWPEALFKPAPSLGERFSLATAEMVAAGRPGICGELYCIRARMARQIFLPRALGAEPALLRELLCTELLSRRADPARITSLPDAAHLADPVAPGLGEWRREILNRATAHALVDYLRSRPLAERRDLIETIRQLDACDPEWLSKLVRQQVRRRRCWQLFPGSLTFRLRQLWHRANWNRWALVPASVVELGRTLGALWSAHGLLRQGIIAEVGVTSRTAVPVHLGTK